MPGLTLLLGRVGASTAGLSVGDGEQREVARAALVSALASGVQMIETASSVEGAGANAETLVGAVIEELGAAAVVVASTGQGLSCRRSDLPDDRVVIDAARTRRRLRVPHIDLYLLSAGGGPLRTDDAIVVLRRMLDDGIARRVGLADATLEEIHRVGQAIPLAAVRSDFSPFDLRTLDVLLWCHRHDVAFLATSPFHNVEGGSSATVQAFQDIAFEIGVPTAQVVAAWAISLSPRLTIVPDVATPGVVAASVAGTQLALEPAVLNRLDVATRRARSDRHPCLQSERRG